MFTHLLIALAALFSAIPGISYGEQHNYRKNGITYTWEREPDFSESKKIYLNAFVKSYNQIPLDVLKQPSKEAMIQWLGDICEKVLSDFKNSTHSLWLSAKANDKLIGYLIIDIEKYPEEIYLAQLAIDPAYQRQGIASLLIRSLFDQFSECGRFVVITRHGNEGAKGLYNSLGFASSSYMHEGYSREFWTGFEYINSGALQQ